MYNVRSKNLLVVLAHDTMTTLVTIALAVLNPREKCICPVGLAEDQFGKQKTSSRILSDPPTAYV